VPIHSLGDPPPYGQRLANIAVSARSIQIFTAAEAAEAAMEDGGPTARSGVRGGPDGSGSSRLEIGGATSARVVRVDQPPKSLTVLCLPLLNAEQSVLCVMELECPWRVVHEDVKLLDCFSVFAALSVERKQLKALADLGQKEIDLNRWLLQDERGSCTMLPMRFVLSPETLAQIWTVNFDAPAWDGVGHIRVLFNIFYKFEIPQTFMIPNDKLFRFISEIRDTYTKVPYHTWRHAVDVSQFVAYEVVTSGLDKVLTKFELFGLFVATICHDANHDGFTNTFNEKAETPLGLLYRNQSVMETHHCTIAIDVMSRDECNLFESLSGDDSRKMWSFIISLILATDMAKHFSFIKQFNDIYDAGNFSPDTEEGRLLMVELVMKCGDISNVSRPFELANKWCDVLCEEFFRQGDLEQANGMEYTSPLNDRGHLDKPKSQIGFYTFVCLPLYQACAKAVPALICNVEQVEANLAIWKDALAKAMEG
jgi:hypothetical protein